MFIRVNRRVGDGSAVPVIVNLDRVSMIVPHETFKDCSTLCFDSLEINVFGTLDALAEVIENAAG